MLADAALGGDVEDEPILANLALHLAEVEVVGIFAGHAGHSIEEWSFLLAVLQERVEGRLVPIEVQGILVGVLQV